MPPIIMEQLVLSPGLNMSAYSSRDTIWLVETSKFKRNDHLDPAPFCVNTKIF